MDKEIPPSRDVLYILRENISPESLEVFKSELRSRIERLRKEKESRMKEREKEIPRKRIDKAIRDITENNKDIKKVSHAYAIPLYVLRNELTKLKEIRDERV